MMEVRCIPQAELDPALADQMSLLSCQAWPGDRAARAQGFLRPPTNPPDLPAPRGRIFHVIQQDDRVVACGFSFGRRILMPAGPMIVLALAGVVSDPHHRGQGLGRAIARSAFDRVDRGDFPVSLYQTTPPVRPFYEKLGARAIDNLIINSLDAASAGREGPKRAFWDPVIMIYPASAPWPAGTIDLLGAGY